MKTSKMLRSTLAALAIGAFSATASASPELWERANAEYDANHYAQALALFEQLANAGDDRAAEVAGHMHALGETLYGPQVRRDATRANRFLAQAAAAGRPVAGQLLGRLQLAAATR